MAHLQNRTDFQPTTYIFGLSKINLGGGLSQNTSQNFSFILLSPNIYVIG